MQTEEICQQCENDKPTQHCYDCDVNLCEDCTKAIHKLKALSKHSLTSLQEYQIYNDDHIATSAEHENDFQNVFVGVDSARCALFPGNRFRKLDEIKDNDIMPVVSIVGPTGAGKSTLLRHFCKESCAKPLSADPKNIESTSSDIHAYIGHFPLAQNPTALMLDSEGINGTFPISIMKLFLHVSAKISDLLSIRKPFVNSAFPRLLYMFSSVFLFMFNGSAREQQTWVSYILSYASSAAAATVNQRTLPTLVIIFNKATLSEGEWDIDKATAQIDAGIFKNFFNAVKVVHIPDRKAAGKIYATQVQALRTLVANSLDKQQLYTKTTVMQQFSIALPELSKNPEAAFNFMDVAIQNLPLPQDYTSNLLWFFKTIFTHELKEKAEKADKDKSEKGDKLNSAAFENAAKALSIRLLDSFQHHLKRNHLPITPGIPEELHKIIGPLETKITRKFMPCTSTCSFPQLSEPVHCSNLGKNHGKTHQSTKTYKETIPATGMFAKFFGHSTTITQSCRWEGTLELPQEYPSGWLKTTILAKHVKAAVSDEDINFFDRHKLLLVSQQNLLSKLELCVCLGCLLEFPTEVLQCDHKLCYYCCIELQVNQNIECPFCNKQGTWKHVDIPEGAGFRILTIDAGGVRGVISAVFLQYIEEQLGVPLHQLFDFVIGTSVGGLHAINFCVMKQKGSDALKNIRQFLEKAFSQKSIGSILMQLYNGYTNIPESLQTFLQQSFPNTPMFSVQLPRVAVVAAEVSEGNSKLALFTSYNAKSTDILRIEGTIFHAAKAAEAGTYFPAFELPGKTIVDGSILCFNPCNLGYSEATRLWKDKQLDYLLSVGSGIYTGPSTYIFGHYNNQAIVCGGHASLKWTELLRDHNELLQKSHRLDLKLENQYNMDDLSNLSTMEKMTEMYIANNPDKLNDVCSYLFAQLFYLVPSTKKPTESCTLELCTRYNNVPHQEKRKLPGAFSCHVTVGGIASTMLKHAFIATDEGIQLEITGLPEKGDIEVKVLCCIDHKGAPVGKEGNPIGGCPLKIKRES